MINESLTTLERDVFLRIVQYIAPKTLRNYIGISEETYQRSKHIHFIIYRLKNNETPVKRLFHHNSVNIFRNRTVRFAEKNSIMVLKDTLLNNILEIKFKVNGVRIFKFGIVPEIKDFTNLNRKLPYPKFFIYTNEYTIIEHDNSYDGIVKRLNRDIGHSRRRDRNKEYKYELYTYVRTADLERVEYNENNTITLLINMLPKQNCMFLWLNDVLSRHALTNIPHRKRHLIFEGHNEITFISINHLSKTPITLNNKFVNWDYNGKNFWQNPSRINSSQDFFNSTLLVKTY
jgi:hypothetical protein